MVSLFCILILKPVQGKNMGCGTACVMVLYQAAWEEPTLGTRFSPQLLLLLELTPGHTCYLLEGHSYSNTALRKAHIWEQASLSILRSIFKIFYSLLYCWFPVELVLNVMRTVVMNAVLKRADLGQKSIHITDLWRWVILCYQQRCIWKIRQLPPRVRNKTTKNPSLCFRLLDAVD